MTNVIDRDTESELGAWARTYAAAGQAVFPLWWPEDGACACPNGRRTDDERCTNAGKHPMFDGGVNGAHRDESRIYRFWQRHPRANIGLPAGANDLAVLDIDPRHGGDDSLERLARACADLGEPLPDTLTQITGSGGRHFVFRAPADGVKNASKSFGPDLPGLDTRGRGGYIVAAPSVHVSGGVYRWPSWLDNEAPWPSVLTRLMDWRPTPPKPRRPAGPAPSSGGYADAALQGELDRVRAAGKGARNHALNRAAYSLGQLVAGGQLGEEAVRDELVAAGVAAGLSVIESVKTVESGLRGGAHSPRRGA